MCLSLYDVEGGKKIKKIDVYANMFEVTRYFAVTKQWE